MRFVFSVFTGFGTVLFELLLFFWLVDEHIVVNVKRQQYISVYLIYEENKLTTKISCM